MFEPVVSDTNLSGIVDYNLLTGGVSLQGSDLLTPTEAKISQGIMIAENLLSHFASNPQFSEQLEIAFGNDYDPDTAENLGQQWASDNFSELPEIRILSSEVLGGANGAFAASQNTIYLSQEFVEGENSGGIASVILEEIGHHVDWKINRFDAAGDEGDIFSRLVQGNSLSDAELAALKVEDDSAVITVNGVEVGIERNTSAINLGINLGSNSYTQAGGNVFRFGVLDQCTEFAFGRALEKRLINPRSGVGSRIRGNAGQWDDQAGYWTRQARANSFVVWDPNQGGAGSVGHVAFVERVNSDGSFLISEFNWNYGDGKFNSRTITRNTNAFNTAKFIYL